jgi:hypothetical protein
VERVSVAISLERLAGAVPAPAVGLHEEAVLREDEVDLGADYAGVDRRPG